MNWGRFRFANCNTGGVIEHSVLGVQGGPVIMRQLDQGSSHLALSPAESLGVVGYSPKDILKRHLAVEIPVGTSARPLWPQKSGLFRHSRLPLPSVEPTN